VFSQLTSLNIIMCCNLGMVLIFSGININNFNDLTS
jgi:hypothetical protein